MKAKIHINTADAESVSSDYKDYTFYLEKPITLHEKSKVYLESIHDVIDPVLSNPTPANTGLLHISGLTPFVISGNNTTYGWTLNAGGYVEEMKVNLTDTSQAFVTASDGFTLKTPGVDFTGGLLKCLIYNDTTTTFNSATTLLVISEVMDMGTGFEIGWLIGIRKRPTGVTFIGYGSNPVFQITSVKDSLVNGNNNPIYYLGNVSSFNPIVSQYSGEANQLDANFTSNDITLGQGLVVKMGTNNSNPTLMQVKSITNGGYGYEVGDYIYVNKKKLGLPNSGTNFLLPIKLQIINISNNPLSSPFTAGLIQSISMSNILNDTKNIRKTDRTNDLVLYNFQQTLLAEEKVFTKNYFDGFLIPQNIIGFTLHFKNSNGLGLNATTGFILEIIIS